jgi:hypothetical protein
MPEEREQLGDAAKELIHHYTSIETLALILKSRKIRFNRLDRVDDVSESTAFGSVDLSKYLFISCWTDEQTESIPQWNMYTEGMRGVRISVPRPPFHYRPVEAPKGFPFEIRGTAVTPIPFEQLITSDYFILPTFVKDFEGRVEYIEDVAGKYAEMVNLDVSTSPPTLNISSMFSLGRFKSARWKFQSEVRYSLFAMPSAPLPASKASASQHMNQVLGQFVHCVMNGIAPGITHFDVDLEPEVVDCIRVTLGPCANEGDKIVVETLLKEFAPRATLTPSVLTGTIREAAR